MLTDSASVHSNTRLHSDILGIIFSIYGREETPSFPLETLLLVCRFWTAVALEHQSIWAYFNLDLVDGATALYWSRVFPRRLERSGTNSLISFALYTTEYNRCRYRKKPHPGCKCRKTIRQQTELIFTLIDERGAALGRRWKEINLTLPLLHRDAMAKHSFFSHPMPHITSLTLSDVSIRSNDPRNLFLPSTPALRSIQINTSSLPSLPILGKVTNVSIYHVCNTGYNHPPLDLSPLADAKQVRCLKLKIASLISYNLPTLLPFLQCIHFKDRFVPDNIKYVSVPALRELGVNPDMMPILLQCANIPFHQIDTLHIRFPSAAALAIMTINQHIFDELVHTCGNIKTFAGDGISSRSMARFLKEDVMGEGVLTDRPIRLWAGKGWRELRAGKSNRLVDVDIFWKELHDRGCFWDDLQCSC